MMHVIVSCLNSLLIASLAAYTILLHWSRVDSDTKAGAAVPHIVAEWAGSDELTGRLIFLFSTNVSTNAVEPRLAASVDGSVQIFGQDVYSIRPNAQIPLNTKSARGFPVFDLGDLPLGSQPYAVQAVLIPYRLYNRSDGHRLWLPDWNTYTYSSDSDDYGWSEDDKPGHAWGARSGTSACGSFYSSVQIIDFRISTAHLKIAHMVPSRPSPPPETQYAKRLEIRSERLSSFWGRDVFIAAWVLLPLGWYQHKDARYPVVVNHGHYSHQAWRGWATEAPSEVVTPVDPDNADSCYYCSTTGCLYDCQSDSFDQLYAHYFARNWTSSGEQSAFSNRRVLLVRVQHQNPFFDASYAVNSANLGPYGDAITYELLPAIERRYRGIGQPWARMLVGGSTGGWASLATQIMYPDEYGGAWGNAPDPVDFHAFSTLNLYKSENAYYNAFQQKMGPFLRVPIPAKRSYLGTVISSQHQVCQYESALGSNSRSGGQYAIWAAVFGPVGYDGYPEPPWDAVTGVINHTVIEHWRRNFDLVDILKRNWANGLGDKLQGKLHAYVGSMDNFYLDTAVFRMQNFLGSPTLKPPARAEFRYGTRNGRGYNHAWSGDNSTSMRVNDLTLFQRLVPAMVELMLSAAPAGADVMSWRY